MAARPRLIVAALVRNEAERFWRSALEAWSEFADEIVVLDDSSTDSTRGIALSFGIEPYNYRDGVPMWGKESVARADLWKIACDHASEGDYILVLDADMVPARDPRPLLASEPDAIAFTLYDLWTPDAYRHDGFWRGHEVPRVWCVRRPATPASGWEWSSRGVHCGHFPANLAFRRVVYAPRDHALLHYAYSSDALRDRKHAAYMSIAEQLTDAERSHAESILAPAQMSPLPFIPQYTLTLAKT